MKYLIGWFRQRHKNKNKSKVLKITHLDENVVAIKK